MGCIMAKSAAEQGDITAANNDSNNAEQSTTRKTSKGNRSSSNQAPRLEGMESTPTFRHGDLPEQVRNEINKEANSIIEEKLTGVITYKDIKAEIKGGVGVCKHRVASYAYGVRQIDVVNADDRITQLHFAWATDGKGKSTFTITSPAQYLDPTYDGMVQIQWTTTRAKDLCDLIATINIPSPPAEAPKPFVPDVALYRNEIGPFNYIPR